MPSSPNHPRPTPFLSQIQTSFGHPNSPYGQAASPFRHCGSATNFATMDPTQSVRSTSPSDTSTSSVSVAISMVDSSSTTSSVYGGDGSLSAGLYRTTSSTSRTSLSLSRRTGSPSKKGSRRTIKLTDYDRRRICEYREANPAAKQDVIGELFGVERSTVSKILKNRDRWLAVSGDDIDEDAQSSFSSATPAFPSPSVHLAAGSLAAVTSGDHSPPPSSTLSTPRLRPGRYPDLEESLANWGRSQFAIVGPSFVFTDETIQRKALELAGEFEECRTFKASAGWMDKFKERAGVQHGVFDDFYSPAERAMAELFSPEEEDDFATEMAVVKAEPEDKVELDAVDTRSSSRKRTVERTRRPGASTRRHSDFPLPTAAPDSHVGGRRSLAQHMELESQSAHGQHPGPDISATPTYGRFSSTPMSATSSRSRAVDPYANYSPQALLALQQQRNNSKLAAAAAADAKTPPVRVSPPHVSLAPITIPTYAPASENAGFYPFSFTAPPYSQDGAFPLQSPFQPNTFAGAQYITTQLPTPTASGAVSPGGYLPHTHVRSNSTASSTSAYSALTAFSQPSNGAGTPLTASSSYSHFPTGVSQPSTPAPGSATGYFGHGDGQQSQLQFAFALEGQASPWLQPAPTAHPRAAPGFPPRRATISGGVSPMSTITAPLARTTIQAAPVAGDRGVLSFDSALASLQTALEYLSAEGNGYVSPMDLIVLSDLKGKMVAEQQKQHPPSSSSSRGSPHSPLLQLQPPVRESRMERSQSGSALGVRTSRRHLGSGTSSLLSTTMDYRT